MYLQSAPAIALGRGLVCWISASTEELYGVDCFEPGSSFAKPECNCFGGVKDAEFDSRPTVKVVSGTWATATISAFLLKVVLEEKIGFPTLLISDYDDMFNDTESVIEGLARGDAHLYPEVWWPICMVAAASSVLPVRRECFDAHALVRKARSRSRIAGRFGVLKRARSSSATYKRRRCGLPVLAAAWTLLNSIAPLACHEPFFCGSGDRCGASGASRP